jgi:hypothetical protein
MGEGKRPLQFAGDIDRLFEVEDTAEEEADAGVWSRDDDRFRCSALLSMAEDAPDRKNATHLRRLQGEKAPGR